MTNHPLPEHNPDRIRLQWLEKEYDALFKRYADMRQLVWVMSFLMGVALVIIGILSSIIGSAQ